MWQRIDIKCVSVIFISYFIRVLYFFVLAFFCQHRSLVSRFCQFIYLFSFLFSFTFLCLTVSLQRSSFLWGPLNFIAIHSSDNNPDSLDVFVFPSCINKWTGHTVEKKNIVLHSCNMEIYLQHHLLTSHWTLFLHSYYSYKMRTFDQKLLIIYVFLSILLKKNISVYTVYLLVHQYLIWTNESHIARLRKGPLMGDNEIIQHWLGPLDVSQKLAEC